MLFVASIEELVATVRAALARVADARTALVGAATPVEAAGRALVELGIGSQQPDLPDSAAHMRTAYDTCRQTVALLDQVTDLANAFLAAIAGVPDHEPWKPVHNEVDKLRRELPPPITAAERGTGRKTHGRWIGPDGGSNVVVSGKDAEARLTGVLLKSLGFPRLAVADHVEMKVAAHLRQIWARTGKAQHATVVVNNRVCAGLMSCADLLPVMLPAGCSLTVHAPNYRRTFTGGAQK
jgi:nucleic acid/nucleotide deaminase of polymorphic system toxin